MFAFSLPQPPATQSTFISKFALLGCLLVTLAGSSIAQAQTPVKIPQATLDRVIKEKGAKPSFESFLLAKLTEAEKLLATNCPIDDETVGISLLDRRSNKIYTVTMNKANFLTAGYQQQFELSDGLSVNVRVDQPNFINTKLSVEAQSGLFLPLTVKYPIVKRGTLKEIGYYTPAHRSIQTANLAKLGEQYIEKVLSDAAKVLKRNGLEIPEKTRKLAQHLCIVEHIDHDRFRNEEPSTLFKEVLALYALNRNDCYRYSVSSAGAGGMVQMISSTYREIKNSFPQVNWVSDFEAGMINHANAAKAMLLYLNRYGEYFLGQERVQSALEAGWATEQELMAAGYNSNPIRVPGKLTHGENWKYALPSETQTYLRILHSLDSSITTEPPRYHAKPVIYQTSKRVKVRQAVAKSHLKSHRVKLRNRIKTSLRNRSTSRTAVKSKRSYIRKNQRRR
ncbi:MAG: hypothetical protein AB1489_16675 [Acidobacteriota bacterium]